jgi:hypothetical protein
MHFLTRAIVLTISLPLVLEIIGVGLIWISKRSGTSTYRKVGIAVCINGALILAAGAIGIFVFVIPFVSKLAP